MDPNYEMVYETVDTSASPANTDDEKLEKNAVGLAGAFGMSLAFISPTTGVLFITTLIASKAGISSPFAFIIGTLGVLLMAWVLAMFAHETPAAGTFYTFNSKGLGPRAGFMTGWLLLIAYGLQGPLNAALFGSFTANVIQVIFHVNIPWEILSVLAIVFVSWLAYRSISRSMKADLVFVCLEVLIVGCLVVWILIHGGAEGQHFAAFTPSQSIQGFSGIGLSFVYILFAFFGFESSITISEETKNPRRNVPIALICSVALTGLYFAITTYAIVVGYGASHIQDFINSPSPISYLADRYLGHGYEIAIDLAGISSLIAVLIAAHTANFRVLYAMGREGALPTSLAKLSKHHTPTNAVIAYSTFSVVVTLITGLIWGPGVSGAYGNLGFWASLGVMPVYLMVCIALWRFARKSGRFSWFKHGVVPFITLIFYIFPIITSLYPYPGMPLAIMPWLTVLFAIIGFGIIFVMGRRDPHYLDKIGKTVFEEKAS
ncbi:MAG TPA: APC family permease [Dictyobacter sp.]|jgi:amino acid transporter|nr:APC family permease [Dictyobacter sp.]